MIELRTLGELAVLVGGEPRRLATDKEAALLVYLASHPDRALRREHLAGLLWEGAEQQRARHSLSQALYQIRRRLPELPIEVSREEVRIFMDGCRVDAQLFRAAVEAQRFDEAVELYRGDFLAGFWLSGTRAFEEWQLGERDELSRLVKQLLHRLLRDAMAGGDWLQVVQYSARLLRLDPYNETVFRARLQAIAAYEGRQQALAEYQRLTGLIRAELGREPEPATKALGARFETDPVGAIALDGDAPADRQWTQFIGRQEEFSRLSAEWELVKAGGGRAVLIGGEPGIGKTRLADQFLRLCAIQGARIFQGRCYTTDRHIPYAGIVSSLLGSIRERDIALLPPEWATVLVEILPELHSLRPELQRAIPLEGEGTRRRLFEAFAQLFHHISAASPVVLHLDDFQWCDESSAALLHYLVRRLVESPVLILLGMRPEGEASHMSPELLAVGEGTGQGFSRISLEPLPYEEVERIIKSFAERQMVQVPVETCQEIYDRVGGRPFFIIEILRAMTHGALDWGDDDPVGRRIGQPAIMLPPSIEEFLQRSMRGLSEDAEPVLSSLSVLGTRADPRVVGEVAGIEANQLIRGVSELRARELIQESDREIYFSHDLIREAAYRLIGKSRRSLLHGAAAAALRKHEEAPPAVLCTHYESAGMRDLAYRYALDAADESARVYGHLETEYFLRIALNNAPGADDLASTKERLATLLLSLSRFSEAEQYLSELRMMDVVEKDPRRLLAIRSKLVTILHKQGSAPLDYLIEELATLVDQAEAYQEYEINVELLKALLMMGHHAGRRDLVLAVIDRVVEVAGMVSSNDTKVVALTFASNAICIYKGVSAALPLAQDAVLLAETSGSGNAKIVALCARGVNHMQAGQLQCAEADFTSALGLIERFAAVSYKQFALNLYGVMLLERGDYEDARRILRDAIGQAVAVSALPDRVLATGNLLLVEHESGNRPEAETLAREVLLLGQQAPFLWATIGAWSILGLYALEGDDLAGARMYRESILEHATGRDFWGSDASYAEIFLARLKVLEGDRGTALGRLEEAIAAYSDRDFFCRSRLQLERARLLLGHDPIAAGQQAAEVRSRGKESGARPLVAQADAILDLLPAISRN